jgi:hypothetical protein
VGRERLPKLAVRLKDVADQLVGQSQVPLPLSVGAIGRGEALANGKAGTVCRQAPRRALPCASSTSPILLCGDRQVRCHTVLVRSEVASGSIMARSSR